MNSLPVESLSISAAIIRELDDPSKTRDTIFKNVAKVNDISVDDVMGVVPAIIQLYKERIRRLE